FNIHEFCSRFGIYHGTALNAFKLLQQNGYLTLTEEMENPARIHFCVSRDDLYKLRVKRTDIDLLLRTILRLYDRVFTEFRPIDEGEIAAVSGFTVERVHELMKLLWQMRVIRYIPSNRSPLIYFDEERLPISDVRIAPETYQHRKQMCLERYEAMLRYAHNEEVCRSAMIEDYFGGSADKDCGVCDICLARRKQTKQQPLNLEEQILKMVAEEPSLTLREVTSRLQTGNTSPLDTVNRLLDEGKISLDKSGIITINR
ncbi:MAG: RecQ family zinc-binding domain-containing protein, partial [Rikenellaceae bacterium]|nr:RecQ family zinc-binding domain-containing protein [Rikenellaceae bacterium]